MTFSEHEVQRDGIGRFSEKLGTAPDVLLTAPAPHWTSPESQQLLSLPTDELDAEDLFDHLSIWERRQRRGVLGKAARHHIAEDWHRPRLPGPRHGASGQLAAGLPWSPAAREVLLSGAKTSQKLRLEHVMPLSVTVDRMFTAYRDGEIGDSEEMLSYLRSAHTGPRFAVITKEEDDLITAAGFKSTLPADKNPLTRYDCLPDSVEGFVPPLGDERYALLFPTRHRRWLRDS